MGQHKTEVYEISKLRKRRGEREEEQEGKRERVRQRKKGREKQEERNGSGLGNEEWGCEEKVKEFGWLNSAPRQGMFTQNLRIRPYLVHTY